MIVIEKINMAAFLIEKAKIQTQLDELFIDIVPIPIKNDQLILPESVLTHSVFKVIFDNFSSYQIRSVSETEYITIALT